MLVPAAERTVPRVFLDIARGRLSDDDEHTSTVRVGNEACQVVLRIALGLRVEHATKA